MAAPTMWIGTPNWLGNHTGDFHRVGGSPAWVDSMAVCLHEFSHRIGWTTRQESGPTPSGCPRISRVDFLGATATLYVYGVRNTPIPNSLSLVFRGLIFQRKVGGEMTSGNLTRWFAGLALALFACVATVGCGGPGAPEIPEDAKEYSGGELTQDNNSATVTVTEE